MERERRCRARVDYKHLSWNSQVTTPKTNSRSNKELKTLRSQWGDIRQQIRPFRTADSVRINGSLHKSVSSQNPPLPPSLQKYCINPLTLTGRTVLWRTYGSCENYGILTGHRAAVLDLQWSRFSEFVFSASADTTIASWDLETGLRIRKHEGHTEIVNAVAVSPRGEEILVSGSDDGSIGIWDPRVKRAVDYIETDFPVTAVAVSEAGNEIYTGGIEGDVKVYDTRRKEVVYRMLGHTDTITSLCTSPDSHTLLSYSHDGLARTWDIKPFAPVDRSLKTYSGAPVGVERNLIRASWDKNGERIGVGGGDGSVCVWDKTSTKLLYKLPGHRGTVNDVRFSPGEDPIMLSGSSDRNLILGELGT